jgi:hypothetical protein
MRFTKILTIKTPGTVSRLHSRQRLTPDPIIVYMIRNLFELRVELKKT